MVVGLGILLAIRLIYFVTSGFAWQGTLAAHEFLPPVDRAVTALSLLAIFWLWSFPEPSRRSTTASLLLAIVILLFLGFSLLTWTSELAAVHSAGFEQRPFFNQFLLVSVGWEILSLGMAGLGGLVLLIRKPNGWGIGLAMLLILGAGHLIQALFPDLSSDYTGMVRLAQMAGFPLLLTLPDRFPYPRAVPTNETEIPLTIERRNYGTESETFRAFVALTTESDPADICVAFTRTVAHVMLADVCFLVTLSEPNREIIFECGYDLIREQGFPGTSFSDEAMPVLYAAMQRNRSLKLPASSTSPDLLGLASALGLERAGHLMAVPIPHNDQYPVSGVVLLSPYSNRGWSFSDQTYLEEAATALALISRRNYELADQHHQVAEALDNLNEARQTAVELKQVNETLLAEIAELKTEAAGPDEETAKSMAALIQAQETAQSTILELQSELETLREQKAHPEPVPAQRADEAISVEEEPPADQAQVIASISQELRQPMSSIIGYTDLLLSESVGMLGALQVKFLARIKASVERMRSMIDDLIQLAEVEPGTMRISTEPVELSEVIDDVIAFTQTQLREKKIILRVDLPDSLPELKADRDALQQILVHLIQNAGSASPVEGKIALRARVDKNGHDSRLLLQVSDSGGGIPEEDLPRVFSRLYQAENRLIQGVGDTGVGLSLAKSLVEAHQGQIWVETEKGDGSTFSVLLPLTNASPARTPPDGLPV